ncbi:MAG: hypothetical protein H6Q70_3206, partial [Firmicutes bacterium]|nr:hypothetical protein [Bacillota bacterium]
MILKKAGVMMNLNSIMKTYGLFIGLFVLFSIMLIPTPEG